MASSNAWVPPGEDLMDAVRALRHAGVTWIAATGWVERAHLSLGPPQAGERVLGRAALVSLQAASEGPVMVTLAYSTPEGTRLTGGALLEANSAGVHLVASTSSASTPAQETAVDGAQSNGAERRPDAARAVNVTLATRAESGVDEGDGTEDECDEIPAFGDRVLHAKFGLCDVMVVKGERLKIRDVHGEKRLREVSLSVLKVLSPRVQDGKRVFPLTRR